MNHILHVDLNEHWRDFIAAKVASGDYPSSEDVLKAALILLEKDEARIDRLDRLLDEGERSGGWEPWDYDKFRAERLANDRGREAA